jgi:hypothetical protein
MNAPFLIAGLMFMAYAVLTGPVSLQLERRMRRRHGTLSALEARS